MNDGMMALEMIIPDPSLGQASLRRLEDTLHGKEDELRKLQHQEAFEKAMF